MYPPPRQSVIVEIKSQMQTQKDLIDSDEEMLKNHIRCVNTLTAGIQERKNLIKVYLEVIDFLSPDL